MARAAFDRLTNEMRGVADHPGFIDRFIKLHLSGKLPSSEGFAIERIAGDVGLPYDGVMSYDGWSDAVLRKWVPLRVANVLENADFEYRDGGVVLYRTIGVAEDALPDLKRLGIYWASDPTGANVYTGFDGYRNVTVTAIAPISSIDVEQTLLSRMNYLYGDDEYEVTLRRGAPITVESITDELGDEIGGTNTATAEQPTDAAALAVDLGALFDQFNQQFWNGALPRPQEFTRHRGKEKVGFVKHLTHQRITKQQLHEHRRYGLHDITYYPTVLSISSAFDMPDRLLREILLHEMIHIYVTCTLNQPQDNHGPAFQKECDRIAAASNGELVPPKRHVETGDLVLKQTGAAKTFYVIFKPYLTGPAGVSFLTMSESVWRKYYLEMAHWVVRARDHWPGMKDLRVLKSTSAVLPLYSPLRQVPHGRIALSVPTVEHWADIEANSTEVPLEQLQKVLDDHHVIGTVTADQDYDARARALAERAYDELVDYLLQPDVAADVQRLLDEWRPMPPYESEFTGLHFCGSHSGYGPPYRLIDTFGLVVAGSAFGVKEPRKLWVAFNTGSTPSHSDIRIGSIIRLPLGPGRVTSARDIRRMLYRSRSTFVHEFIHFLDHNRRTGGHNKFDKDRDADEMLGLPDALAQYFNRPSEMNAHYQAAISDLVASIRKVKGTRQERTLTEFMLRATPQQFADSMLGQMQLQYLTEANRRRLLKRLAAFWTWWRSSTEATTEDS